MNEKDLDIAIEKCERIMEMDTRTMQNPVSENGWIFDKVYDLLKFLRQFEFETGGMDDTISRRAAIDTAIEAVDDWDGGTNIGRQKRIEKAIKALLPVQSEPKSYRMGFQAGYAAAQRWIPVTEKCPEIGQIVLCSLKARHYYGRIHVCKYCAADKYYNHPYFDWSHNGFPDVVAWMPLQEPYYPEGEEHEQSD